MVYIFLCLGGIIFVILYAMLFDLIYTALLRKKVKKNQEKWDKIKTKLEEEGADNIEIAAEYLKFTKTCGCGFPSM